jgi:hypothetical protein
MSLLIIIIIIFFNFNHIHTLFINTHKKPQQASRIPPKINLFSFSLIQLLNCLKHIKSKVSVIMGTLCQFDVSL